MASPRSHRPREKAVEGNSTFGATLHNEIDTSLDKSWYHPTTCECGCGGAGKNWIAQQREKNKK